MWVSSMVSMWLQKDDMFNMQVLAWLISFLFQLTPQGCCLRKSNFMNDKQCRTSIFWLLSFRFVTTCLKKEKKKRKNGCSLCEWQPRHFSLKLQYQNQLIIYIQLFQSACSGSIQKPYYFTFSYFSKRAPFLSLLKETRLPLFSRNSEAEVRTSRGR